MFSITRKKSSIEVIKNVKDKYIPTIMRAMFKDLLSSSSHKAVTLPDYKPTALSDYDFYTDGRITYYRWKEYSDGGGCKGREHRCFAWHLGRGNEREGLYMNIGNSRARLITQESDMNGMYIKTDTRRDIVLMLSAGGVL